MIYYIAILHYLSIYGGEHGGGNWRVVADDWRRSCLAIVDIRLAEDTPDFVEDNLLRRRRRVEDDA